PAATPGANWATAATAPPPCDPLLTTACTLPATACTFPTALAIFARAAHLTITFGAGMWKQCMVMSMFARAARLPPMYTLFDPVTISNMADKGGAIPQQVGLNP